MKGRQLVVALALAGIIMPGVVEAGSRQSEGRYDQKIQTAVTEELKKKDQLRDVSAAVEDGIVTLSGSVDLFVDKMNAEKHIRKLKNVDGVRNRIVVSGKQVSDAELTETMANRLRYDRVGYGIMFNTLTVSVDGGAVTIGGKVRDYPDRDSAIAIVQTTPGVVDVIDEIDVAPVSTFDDQLRIRLARAVYGQASLQKYAIDPQAPIRIIVENGHVKLAGMVLNKGDRQLAFMQANSVPGVFSVKNSLMVASGQSD